MGRGLRSLTYPCNRVTLASREGVGRPASGSTSQEIADEVPWLGRATVTANPMRRLVASILVVVAFVTAGQPAAARERWSEKEAAAWYSRHPWLVGANYIPSDAINQLEMWQADTWAPQRIDLELSWAQAIGMNTMRVFLDDLLWEQDATGFRLRIDQFLEIASRHGIKPLFVLFDSCWDPHPKLGPQHPPIPGVHNSGWVQSPGIDRLRNPANEVKFKAYVQGVISALAQDDRVLGWDVWNEPDNPSPDYQGQEGKIEIVEHLLPQVFAWARAVNPSQPVTSGLWRHDDWSPTAKLTAIERVQVDQSDVLSFHDYRWPEQFERRVQQLELYRRPVLCTEYMARGNGSTIDTVLPIGKRHRVGMINWGLVEGKTQTRFPWDSWKRPYTLEEPTVWFHDIFHADGTPYRKAETDLIRQLAGARTDAAPATASSLPQAAASAH
jgi:hypothetical protein